MTGYTLSIIYCYGVNKSAYCEKSNVFTLLATYLTLILLDKCESTSFMLIYF